MRKLLAVAALASGLALVPALGRAQGGIGTMPHHEFGVDLAMVYQSPSGGNGVFQIMTPVDVRLGFVSASKVSLEPRLVLNFVSSSGSTAYDIGPDLNVLWKLGAGHGPHNLMGPYLTAGAGINIISFGSGNSSGATVTLNAGIGTRARYGSGAFRLEGFVAYTPRNTSLGTASTLAIGARAGVSLWH
jgi:hypothetical protein